MECKRSRLSETLACDLSFRWTDRTSLQEGEGNQKYVNEMFVK